MHRLTASSKPRPWPPALAGDVNSIKVGSKTNIQDNTIVHVSRSNVGGRVLPTIIGDRVTIGNLLFLLLIQGPQMLSLMQPALSGPLAPTRAPPESHTRAAAAALRSGGSPPNRLTGPRMRCGPAGHGAVLHACTVHDEAFVGMGATLLDGAVVEKGAMVAAGATVTPGSRVPAGQIWAVRALEGQMGGLPFCDFDCGIGRSPTRALATLPGRTCAHARGSRI